MDALFACEWSQFLLINGNDERAGVLQRQVKYTAISILGYALICMYFVFCLSDVQCEAVLRDHDLYGFVHVELDGFHRSTG